MKNLKQFIDIYEENLLLESKKFVLTNNERDSLLEVFGYITGNLGNDEDIDTYKSINLTDEELDQANDLFNVLDDNYSYKDINESNIKNDIQLINKVLSWCDRNNLLIDYDLQSVYEKTKNIK